MKHFDWWNIVFILFFILLSILATQYIFTNTGFYELSIWEYFILVTAIFRLTRLTTYDQITTWVRDMFEDARPKTFAGTVKTLINCPWCTGLWFALVVLFSYLVFPFAIFPIYILSLAGVASVVQLAANLLGWSAELKKTVTLEQKR